MDHSLPNLPEAYFTGDSPNFGNPTAVMAWSLLVKSQLWQNRDNFRVTLNELDKISPQDAGRSAHFGN